MKMTPERKKQRLLLPVPFYHSHLQEETRVSVISCRKLWAAVMAPLPAPPPPTSCLSAPVRLSSPHFELCVGRDSGPEPGPLGVAVEIGRWACGESGTSSFLSSLRLLRGSWSLPILPGEPLWGGPEGPSERQRSRSVVL